MDWDIVQKAGSILGALSAAGTLHQGWAIRQRATNAAIDRVEAKASAAHQEQEERIIRLEQDMRHTIGAKELAAAIEPLYKISRASEANIAALTKGLEGLEKGQAEIRLLILQRGLEK